MDVMHALDSSRRREILRLVWEEERAAGDIHRALGDVTFGAVSQHLRVLVEAGVVKQRKDGRFRRYRADREALGPLAAWLEQHWDGALSRLKALAEGEEET